MDLSLLMKGNPRDFTENISEIEKAHDEIMKIRQSIFEEESTMNLRIQFQKLGLDFDNKMTNKDLLQQMNRLDAMLMHVRGYLRAKNNGGIQYVDENTPYENGLNVELLRNMRDRIDLSLLVAEEPKDAISMSEENIKQAHNEIMRMRQLIWVEAIKILKAKLAIDGIEFASENFGQKEYFDKLDDLDLKLMQIRTLKRTIERNGNGSSIYKHGTRDRNGDLDDFDR